MIYDTFCFFNELDLLEIRLNTLDSVVDKFVLSEASVTHTGVAKPFYFEENKERFEKFLPKIIHVKVYDTPNRFDNLDSGADEIFRFANEQTQRFNRKTEVCYGRDFFQKETVRRGLRGLTPYDLVMFSDCDEIPHPDTVKSAAWVQSIYGGMGISNLMSVRMNTFYFYVNVLKQTDWLGTRIGLWKDLQGLSFNELRAGTWSVVEGGWHFSFMGGADRVRQKIEAYSAQELATPKVMASIEANMASLNDPFFRGTLKRVSLPLPEFLEENRERLSYLWLL
jgi:beta-1,4-mannosyl-glycoprotein beta-1,4-N-acetylglucosaminyltransferase